MSTPDQPIVRNQSRSPWRWAVTLVLCLMILAAGIGISKTIEKTAPKARKKVPSDHLLRVETLTLQPGVHQVTISAMGTVVPSNEVTLRSRVSGQVQALHPEFVAGGFIAKGERILKIDPRDYELALVRKESQLVTAQYGLKVEMGYQEVAKREWSLLNQREPADPADLELALRKPHLAKTKSDVAAAQAELEQAKLDLSRTNVKAPFNALVLEKYVDVGSQISTQDALAELVGTDVYWIRVSIPVERLKWFRIPTDRTQQGAVATVHFRGNQRTGRVVRVLANLETKGRMARILVSVTDPLGLDQVASGSPPLLIGEYVRVSIQGHHLPDVYRVPRSALRDGSTIWLVDSDGTLSIRRVETVWRDEAFVLIQDHLAPGDRLVTSNLTTPVSGMAVKIVDRNRENDPSPEEAKARRHES